MPGWCQKMVWNVKPWIVEAWWYELWLWLEKGSTCVKKGLLHVTASSCERQRDQKWKLGRHPIKVQLLHLAIQLWNLNGILHFFSFYAIRENIPGRRRRKWKAMKATKWNKVKKFETWRRRSWTFFCSLEFLHTNVSSHFADYPGEREKL